MTAAASAAKVSQSLVGEPSGAGELVVALSVVVAGGAGLGLVMGALLGAVQGWALRTHVERPGLWVAASAIAWVPAMAVVFAGATTPGADWSSPRVALLGCLTGAVAGAVLGAVLARCVPWLGQSTSRP